MSIEQNKANLRRWLEAYNSMDADMQVELADELYTADFTGHGFGPGLEDVKQFVRNAHGSPPVGPLVIEDLIGESDQVVARFSVSGVDMGTGKLADIQMIAICRFVEGKMAEAWQMQTVIETPG
jgi:hypothetical protein